jgi:hypothetical protein
MRIFFDNVENLKTVLPGCVIERRVAKDEESGSWFFEEICYKAKSPSYFWHVRKYEFTSQEEMEAYVVLHILESGSL